MFIYFRYVIVRLPISCDINIRSVLCHIYQYLPTIQNFSSRPIRNGAGMLKPIQKLLIGIWLNQRVGKMSVEVKDCDGGLGSCFMLRGVASAEEYVDVLRRHLEQDEEKYKQYLYGFTDCTGVSQFDISTPHIQQIADMCVRAMQINPDAIVAIAADQDLYYGFSRMFDALVFKEGWETNVFRSKKEAVEWIRERVRDKFGIDDLTFN